MTERKSYWELLRDPRWQRRRLQVMERAEFRCENCDAADKTLNVHHKLYRKGAKPWEYADHALQCLCEDCHEIETHAAEILKETVALLDSADRDVLLGFAMAMRQRDRIVLMDNACPLPVKNYEHALGIAMYLHGQVGPMDIEPFLVPEISVEVFSDLYNRGIDAWRARSRGEG